MRARLYKYACVFATYVDQTRVDRILYIHSIRFGKYARALNIKYYQINPLYNVQKYIEPLLN